MDVIKKNPALVEGEVSKAVDKIIEIGKQLDRDFHKIIESGKLEKIGENCWRSKAGLFYEEGSIHGNRIKHILVHTYPDLNRPMHSIFNATEDVVIKLVDEAWLMRNTGQSIIEKNGYEIFNIPMKRIIGNNGEKNIRIVVKAGTPKIISSYPIK